MTACNTSGHRKLGMVWSIMTDCNLSIIVQIEHSDTPSCSGVYGVIVSTSMPRLVASALRLFTLYSFPPSIHQDFIVNPHWVFTNHMNFIMHLKALPLCSNV